MANGDTLLSNPDVCSSAYLRRNVMNRPGRFVSVSLIPLMLWIGFVILNEKRMWPSPGFRITYGIVFITAFYGISIYLIFRKNLSKWLIALLLLPPTAVITYVVLIFL